MTHYELNTRRACRLVKQTRSVHYYRSVKNPRHDLRARMREIAQTRVRYGYRRIHVLLKCEWLALGTQADVPAIPGARRRPRPVLLHAQRLWVANSQLRGNWSLE